MKPSPHDLIAAIMRWETTMEIDFKTISAMLAATGTPLTAEHEQRFWRDMDEKRKVFSKNPVMAWAVLREGTSALMTWDERPE